MGFWRQISGRALLRERLNCQGEWRKTPDQEPPSPILIARDCGQGGDSGREIGLEVDSLTGRFPRFLSWKVRQKRNFDISTIEKTNSLALSVGRDERFAFMASDSTGRYMARQA